MTSWRPRTSLGQRLRASLSLVCMGIRQFIKPEEGRSGRVCPRLRCPKSPLYRPRRRRPGRLRAGAKPLRQGCFSKVRMNIRASLTELCDAFTAHDLDRGSCRSLRIIAYWRWPRGSSPFGSRFEGKRKVREGLSARFEGLPDVHYGHEAKANDGEREEW